MPWRPFFTIGTPKCVSVIRIGINIADHAIMGDHVENTIVGQNYSRAGGCQCMDCAMIYSYCAMPCSGGAELHTRRLPLRYEERVSKVVLSLPAAKRYDRSNHRPVKLSSFKLQEVRKTDPETFASTFYTAIRCHSPTCHMDVADRSILQPFRVWTTLFPQLLK